MRSIFGLVIALTVATVTGVGTAWYAIEQGQLFGAVAAGNWTAWPGTGSEDPDPYSMAMLARTGEVPLGAGEGLAFSATLDHDGNLLTSTCVYRVSGEAPAARLWTLTAYDEQGQLMANAARRTGFHSREVIRDDGGRFSVTVSAEVAPGNWLPIGTSGNFALVFRLYDTPLTTGSQIGDLVMPDIGKVGCR